ncbi:MAG: transposase [Deltaproteobacteria bacterium]|nr:transposase [Deltaproteobacteria bacterium]
MKLHASLSRSWLNIQRNLFPWLKEEVGELTEKSKWLITILELVRVEEFVSSHNSKTGRPLTERSAIVRSFVAKAVYGMPTTRVLIDRLSTDNQMRTICGWTSKGRVPSESTFSRAFAEFSEDQLVERIHSALIAKYLSDKLIGHISRDSTEIEAREKPQKKSQVDVTEAKPKRKPGRPKKGEEVIKENSRLKRQQDMTLEQMLDDLPKVCDVGSKRNSKGYKETWTGYKLHIDAADGQIPVSCVLSSASVHDSQVALPLAEITARRVTNLYDLMDSAYDAQIIKEHSCTLGHVPIIDINPRSDARLKEVLEAEHKRLKITNFSMPEDIRYRERATVERVNRRVKDEFGGRSIPVRGHAKVMTHLMFGILALAADQLIRLVI